MRPASRRAKARANTFLTHNWNWDYSICSYGVSQICGERVTAIGRARHEPTADPNHLCFSDYCKSEPLVEADVFALVGLQVREGSKAVHALAERGQHRAADSRPCR